jgi:predicted nucleic-acid-binding Zn-ribbon protein
MWYPIMCLCLLSFLLGISVSNSWHDSYRKHQFNKEKCSKGGIHDWHLKQIFTENGIDYSNKEYLIHECSKCGMRDKYLR